HSGARPIPRRWRGWSRGGPVSAPAAAYRLKSPPEYPLRVGFPLPHESPHAPRLLALRCELPHGSCEPTAAALFRLATAIPWGPERRADRSVSYLAPNRQSEPN